jgi:hypothetical protein
MILTCLIYLGQEVSRITMRTQDVKFTKRKCKCYAQKYVMRMLAFNISAIDVAISISVIVLGLLFLSILKSDSKPSQEPLETVQNSVPKANSTQKSNGSGKCTHYFGYLRSYPDNIPIPDDCANCAKGARCLRGVS